MSGGHFGYIQHRLSTTIEELEEVISDNKKEYSEETLKLFEEGLAQAEKAKIYIHRIDWLVSGDDCENDFKERLLEDLGELKSTKKEKL